MDQDYPHKPEDHENLIKTLFEQSQIRHEKLFEESQLRFHKLLEESQLRYEKMIENSQKRYEGLVHEDKDEMFKTNMMTAFITGFVILISVFATLRVTHQSFVRENKLEHEKMQFSIEDEKKQALGRQAHSIINDDIEIDKSRKILMKSISDVRAIRNYGQNQCKNGKYGGPDTISYDKQTIFSAFQLSDITFIIRKYLDDNIMKKIYLLQSLTDVDKNPICNKKTVQDLYLRKLQVNINESIIDVLRKNEQVIDKLNQKIDETNQEITPKPSSGVPK
jgi:hypothetical protein